MRQDSKCDDIAALDSISPKIYNNKRKSDWRFVASVSPVKIYNLERGAAATA